MHERPYSDQLAVNKERGGGLGIRPATGRADRPARSGSNRGWWPDQLDLTSLRRHRAVADPMGADFDYAAAFATLDLDAVVRDVDAVLTTSQDWWPADFGHYGPLMVRMAWHCAGT
jgi:catalase-peroxidase